MAEQGRFWENSKTPGVSFSPSRRRWPSDTQRRHNYVFLGRRVTGLHPSGCARTILFSLKRRVERSIPPRQVLKFLMKMRFNGLVMKTRHPCVSTSGLISMCDRMNL